MKTLTTKLSLIFLAFLIACTPVSPQVSTPTIEIKPSATVEPIPTSTTIPTPSPNILELESAIELTLPTYKSECVNILSFNAKTLQDFSTKGTAVFSATINDNTHIVLYNLASGEKQIIPEGPDPNLWANSPTVSPDRKWLFYLATKDGIALGKANFVLSNSNGEIAGTIPVSIVEDSGYYFDFAHEWLGDNAIRLWTRKTLTDDKLIVLLLDPFTKKTKILESNFDGLQSSIVKPGSGIGPADEYLDWGTDPSVSFPVQGTNITYSPDENIAFFPHQDGYDVLYDLENNEELARITVPKWGELPRWSTAGEYLSIIADPSNSSGDSLQRDFYLLSRDGKSLKRITYLSEQFDRVSIRQYAWSPDGTKIALRLNTKFPVLADEIVPYELAIVDVTTGNITNYCIPYYGHIDSSQELGPLFMEPIWSPDSSQLLVPSRIPAKTPGPFHDYDMRTILLDPSKLSAVEILDSVRIHGWMTNDQ